MASDEAVKLKSKKDNKEKKSSSSDGVKKSKSDKKEKKAEKEKLKQKVAKTLDQQLQADAAASSKVDDEDDHPGSDIEDIKNADIQTQIVYFAVPLADAKGHKKIYKTIKKGMYAPTARLVMAHQTDRPNSLKKTLINLISFLLHSPESRCAPARCQGGQQSS